MLIHQQHDSSEYKVRGGNGNVLITLEAGVERDIRNYYKITCLARWSLKFQNKLDRNYSHKTVNKINYVLCLVVGGAIWHYCDCVDPGNPCTSLSALPGYPCPHYLLNKY